MTMASIDTGASTLLEISAPLRVLVLGGNGFLGRHAVAALCEAGASVSIGTRRPERIDESTWGRTLREVRFESLLSRQAWLPLLSNIDVVINCVGILRQRPGESYEAIHHHAPAALASACAQTGVRFIHTSALGLHEGAKSRFLSSKLRGEVAIRASGCDYALVRPSLLDGVGGFGATWLRGLSRSPVHLIPRGARGGIAALVATDFGLALAALARLPHLAAHRDVELGGLHHYGYGEYLRELRSSYTVRHAWQVPLPNWMARVGAHLCDVFHFSPFSYGHWLLLQRDNIPRPNRLPELLGRDPLVIRPRAATSASPASPADALAK